MEVVDLLSSDSGEDEENEPVRKRSKPDSVPAEQPPTAAAAAQAAAAEEDNEAVVCTICLETFAVAGPHRTVSLPCGHLFGEHCIKQWLQQSRQQCPQCKAR
jgi:E3 ubiquitin-protein ligase RFWD3